MGAGEGGACGGGGVERDVERNGVQGQHRETEYKYGGYTCELYVISNQRVYYDCTDLCRFCLIML